VTAAALAAVPLFGQQNATHRVKDDVALRAAMEKETVQGDLKGAIEQFALPRVSRTQALRLLRLPNPRA
jgi:hypothetical protein